MEMPEGWKRLIRRVDTKGKNVSPTTGDLYDAAYLMKEMAEALDDMEAYPYEPIGMDGLAALKKFKEWK